jgi:pilus assembly protein CpaE
MSVEVNLLDPGARRQDNALEVAIAGGTDSQRATIRTIAEAVTELTLRIVEAPGPTPKAGKPMAGAGAILALLGEDSETWPEECYSYIHARPQSRIIALIPNRSAQAVRTALRAGASEVLFLPLQLEELTGCLVKISEAYKGLGGARRSITCSMASIAGGVGVSSLTVALGLALRRISQKQVALVDLGLQCAALSSLLGLEPERTIADLVDPTSKVDSIRLESVLCKHESGLQVLGAPRRIEDGEMVSAATITATLTAMREMFDFVLVDSGHNLTEASVAAWQQSTSLVYLLNQTVTSIRPAQRFVELFERLGLTDVRMTLVLNRYRPKHPITREKVEKALRRVVGATVPDDEEAFGAIQMVGADLAQVAANSPARHSVDELAANLAGVSAHSNGARAPGLFSRLRSAIERRPEG